MDDCRAKIMGIINLNTDSFYAPSRAATVDAFRRRADGLLGRGVDILDLGACSSRPGSEEVDVETEWARLEPVLEIVARDYADVSISIDTYRASIVTMAYQTIGRFIVNDISSGEWDEAMLPVNYQEDGVSVRGFISKANARYGRQNGMEYKLIIKDITKL